MSSTKAIVCRPPQDGHRRWAIEEVEVKPPGVREVLVRVIASGVCHTDLGCGSFPDGVGFPTPPYPRILGHEGAGYVLQVGSDVTKVRPGDSVLLSFAFCEECHSCKYGAPGYCAEFTTINFSGDAKAFELPESSVGGSFFGQSSFSNLTRVQETSIVNVTGLVKSEIDLKTFAPLGCGIQTGAGTISELADAGTRDAVAVLGLGGVGLAAIMAAKLRGCRTIIGIDRVPSRLDLARQLGATATVNTSDIGDNLNSHIRRMTNGTGTTITVDATGIPSLIRSGLDFTSNQGKMILLGVAPADAKLEIPIVSYMVSGKQLLGSMEGGVRPSEYIPRMIQWYREGDFPVDRLIKFYNVNDFATAIHDMESGETIKPVLLW